MLIWMRESTVPSSKSKKRKEHIISLNIGCCQTTLFKNIWLFFFLILFQVRSPSSAPSAPSCSQLNLIVSATWWENTVLTCWILPHDRWWTDRSSVISASSHHSQLQVNVRDLSFTISRGRFGELPGQLLRIKKKKKERKKEKKKKETNKQTNKQKRKVKPVQNSLTQNLFRCLFQGSKGFHRHFLPPPQNSFFCMLMIWQWCGL